MDPDQDAVDGRAFLDWMGLMLPEGAVSTARYTDPQGDKHLILANAPSGNYLCTEPGAGSGSFVIGGDRDYIARHLDWLTAEDQEKWHLVAIPESQIQASGAPRWVGTDTTAQTDDVHQAPLPPQGLQGAQATTSVVYGNNNGGFGRGVYDPALGNNINTNTNPNRGAARSTDQTFLDQQRGLPSSTSQSPTMPSPQRNRCALFSNPTQRQLDQVTQNLAIISSDEVFGDYSGRNICRWCGRNGHEAADCIKWDPVWFDKLVCVACNNKKHHIDECDKFTKRMTWEEQKALLLDRGANKPGVRSFFNPWVRVFRPLLPSPPPPPKDLCRHFYIRY